MSSTKHNLQPQQQLAVSLYMKSMNKTQAAKDAGYESTSVFNNRSVKAAINEQMAIRAKRLRIGADWVLAEAVKVYQRCMQLELVTIKDRDGLPLGEFRFDAANAIKALTLIGKHVDVKAFDPSLMINDVDSEVMARLKRGRDRLNQEPLPNFFGPASTYAPESVALPDEPEDVLTFDNSFTEVDEAVTVAELDDDCASQGASISFNLPHKDWERFD